jgi:hypothetical protein
MRLARDPTAYISSEYSGNSDRFSGVICRYVTLARHSGFRKSSKGLKPLDQTLGIIEAVDPDDQRSTTGS